VNMSSDHIVDGNPKMTLGLLWSIIQRWQVFMTVSLMFPALRVASTLEDDI